MQEEGHTQGLMASLRLPKAFMEQNRTELNLLSENSAAFVALDTFQWEGEQRWRYRRPTGPERLRG